VAPEKAAPDDEAPAPAASPSQSDDDPPEPPDGPGDVDPGGKKKRRKSPWWLKAMIVLGAVLIVASGGALALIYGLSARYDNKVQRQDILQGVPPATEEERGNGLNFLVLGSDSRDGNANEGLDATGSRSDTIMLVHVKGDQSGIFIASIPRDSYVDVPAGGAWKGGKNKINAALSFGGANLAAKTIYQLTQVPLSGAMIVNFNGVQKMVAAVGGVRVCTPFTVRSYFSNKVWEKGCHDMTPEDAEEFVRQRYYVPGGDFGRIKNQQNVIKGLMQKVTTTGVLTNPAKMDSLLTTAAESLTVDKDMNLRELAFALKGVRPDDVKFATVPVAGLMNTDAGSSVRLDMPGVQALMTAIRDDKTDEWLAAHPQPDVASF
jgi:LCP family protein required for cell wall assembly